MNAEKIMAFISEKCDSNDKKKNRRKLYNSMLIKWLKRIKCNEYVRISYFERKYDNKAEMKIPWRILLFYFLFLLFLKQFTLCRSWTLFIVRFFFAMEMIIWTKIEQHIENWIYYIALEWNLQLVLWHVKLPCWLRGWKFRGNFEFLHTTCQLFS